MFAISPTDNEWFTFLKESGYNSFINFWTPTPWNIKKLHIGDRWYFLLKSPVRKIGGFGEFFEYKNLKAIDAWNEFGIRNGCLTKAEFIGKIQSYIEKNSKKVSPFSVTINEYKIGCITLNNCAFWDEENYKDLSSFNIKFPSQIVKQKYFKQEDSLADLSSDIELFNLISEPREEYKSIANLRKGQNEFKRKIMKAYDNRCCISGETCPELLEAAHIQPYLSNNSNHIQNGLLLRIDLHRLFDNGLLHIDDDYIIHVSSQLVSLDYQRYHGKQIFLPKKQSSHPSRDALALRKENFRE